MRIEVKRYNRQSDFTQSLIFLDGKFECYGLEDEIRPQKLYAETAIPKGIYKIELRKEGRFHQNYSKKFSHFHEGMLHVTNVPGFEYILIHIGNTDDDTAGCLLVGRSALKDSIAESTIAYQAMYQKVISAFEHGEEVTIEYLDI